MSVLSFSYATYLENGELEKVQQIDTGSFSADLIQHFDKILEQLSGDLELPYEFNLPGPIAHCECRIASDLLGGAYVMQYYHDELVMVSLILQGVNPGPEDDLLHVLKYLLLEPDDSEEEDEPTSEQMDEIMALDAFNFAQHTVRPIVLAVRYELDEEEPDVRDHIEQLNFHLATAFLSKETPQVERRPDKF